jgi:hypothetical protein
LGASRLSARKRLCDARFAAWRHCDPMVARRCGRSSIIVGRSRVEVYGPLMTALCRTASVLLNLSQPVRPSRFQVPASARGGARVIGWSRVWAIPEQNHPREKSTWSRLIEEMSALPCRSAFGGESEVSTVGAGVRLLGCCFLVALRDQIAPNNRESAVPERGLNRGSLTWLWLRG